MRVTKCGLSKSLTVAISALLLSQPLCGIEASGSLDDRGSPLPSALGADPVIYDNGVTPLTGFFSQLDTVFPFDSQAADDFILPVGDGNAYGVTGISFEGRFTSTPPSGPGTTDFNVLFYADNGSGTAPVGGPLDPTGSAIAVRTVLSAVGVNVGVERWYWNLSWNGNAVNLMPNTQYWVAVQWVGVFPPQFSWSADDVSGNAVAGYPLINVAYWTPVNAEMDFLLYGVQVAPIFVDGFESGNTSAWSATSP
ncbi:MAG: hypothetical protein K8J08_20410 [Thermoanaerobaculia bacterium]|nr:hypothetical protein [Thermoanaerobaculia bacterium]